MADKDYVISVLRATLQSCKGAVPLNQCNRDYKELEGDYIPFKKLGFGTLEEFLSGVPEIKIFRNSYGEVLVDAVATENTSHLAELVARQKSNTKKSAPRMNYYHQLRMTKFDAPWRRQTPAYGSNTQFYKQYNPHRATTAYNNNSYSNNKNNYSKSREPYINSKMPEPPRRLPSEARPAPTRRSPPPGPTPAPPAAPAFITTAKLTQNSVAKSNSVVKPNSVVKSNPAPAPAKTPAEERKPSGLSLTARMQTAVALADEADNHRSRQSPVNALTPKPKLSKASSRLSNLRESLHSDLIPLPLPATELHNPPPPLVDIVTPAPQLSPLPLDATAQEKLAWTCKKLNMPEPIYKINSMKDSKRGPTIYFCVVKVGSDHSATTYPNTSPSEDSSRELAAARLQAELESSPSPAASSAALPALDGSLHLITSSPAAAIAGLADLVATHESGLWASTVPIRYREKYNENLPVNWQDLVEKSSKFKTDRGANGQLMILPNNNMMINCSRVLTAGDWWLSHCSNLGACDIQHCSPVLSDLARLKCTTKSWRKPAPRSALEREAGPVLELPELQLPNQSGWNVYITSVSSTVEVWLRLIGDEYSTEYEDLQTSMKLYYENTYSLVTLVEINAWYAVELEEGWHRGLVVEVLNEESVLVFLGDHGDDEVVPISKLRVLAHQFTNLAPQAILCRLDKMEELGASEVAASIVRSHLVGEVLVAVPAPPPPDPAADDCFSVILFRTLETEDVNVNEQILKEICELGEFNLTEASGGMRKLLDVEVGCVSAEGQVWLVNPVGAKLVREALTLLTSPGPYHRPMPDPSNKNAPKSNMLYVVQTLSGEWLRCLVRTGRDANETVSTRLVDSGQTMRAPLSSLIPLLNYSRVLALFPHQAKAVRLGSAERAASAMVGRLRELLLNQSVLCRALADIPASHSPHEPNVDLFVRQQGVLASVNSTILFEFDNQKTPTKEKEEPKSNPLDVLSRKKERIFSRTVSGTRLIVSHSSLQLPPLALPATKEWVNVLVTMAANPCNFVVQLSRKPDTEQLSELMVVLQKVCPQLTAADTPASPASGELYAVYYDKDKSWYRVVVANVVSQDMVSVYYCDFGDLALVSSSELRRLPDSIKLARSLPPQAIKAKLYGVSPLHQDWSVEDCIRFQELCVNREFAALVQDIGGEPLLTVDLVDTTTNEDVYIKRLLSDEKRAKLTVTESPV